MKFYKGLILSIASIAMVVSLTACGATKQQSQNTNKQTTTIQNQQKASSAKSSSNSSQNKATSASGTKTSSKNNKTKKTILKIKGTVQNVNIQQHDTILKVKLNAEPKFVSKNKNVSVSKGSVITIFTNATPSQYGVGGGGQKSILVVKKGTQIVWNVTYKKEKDNIKWTGSFDDYLFRKNGVYLNWKGQSFGKGI